MTAVTLNFTALPDTSPYSPPTDWLSVGQIPARIFGGAWTSTGSTNTIWIYDKVPLDIVSSEALIGTINSSDSRGPASVNSSGNGYILLVRSTDARLFLVNAGVLGTQVGSTYSGTFALNDVVTMTHDPATGGFIVYKNAVQITTFSNNTYTTGMRAGIMSRAGGGYIKSVTVSDYSVQTITSINGGSPITAGQTGIPIVATGFTAKPTSVTATYSSGTKSITATVDSGGTATNFNISIQDRIDAEDWPINGDTLTYTFAYLAESAALTQTLVKKATETILTFSGAVASDPANLTYWLAQDGFTAEGGELAYIPYGDLVLTADGGGTATDAGTFTSWFRPATGAGAGNVYANTWVVSEAGITTSASGLTSSGLTDIGLTNAGLTSSGL